MISADELKGLNARSAGQKHIQAFKESCIYYVWEYILCSCTQEEVATLDVDDVIMLGSKLATTFFDGEYFYQAELDGSIDDFLQECGIRN